ncbi:hypothetical protein KIN20_018387 [Parelaphostrongylus tenuis]|uniref:Uncharacterized protein n=1 Tax=Parelaphostrongylus tenuis TaxID=148309 RepID=A0AAD5N461_PARTN|nr:hypothetical protein KIN20_018387 [Parelaphostrongylus tenuis]
MRLSARIIEIFFRVTTSLTKKVLNEHLKNILYYQTATVDKKQGFVPAISFEMVQLQMRIRWGAPKTQVMRAFLKEQLVPDLTQIKRHSGKICVFFSQNPKKIINLVTPS